jgi:hypothetical protein
MATITKGKTFTSNETVTPTKLNDLVDKATISGIVNADIAPNAAIADTKLATISTAAKVANSATTATNLNSANAIVARDASGNFSAGTITASLSGNSSTASQWANGRNLSLTGDVTATLSTVNGSVNVSAAATIAKSAVTNSKLRNSAALSVIGNSTNAAAEPADIAAGTDGFVLRRSGTTLGFGQITAAGIAADAVTTAKIATGSITAAKLSSEIFLVPAGAVMAFAMNSVPAGWLPCNGAPVLISAYPNLASAIYCGDALNPTAGYGYKVTSSTGTTRSTTGTYITVPDLRGYFVRGHGTNADGTVSGSFGAKQADEFKSHSHTYTQPKTPGSYYDNNNDEVGVKELTTNAASGLTGGTETRPKNIAMLYCIKF